MRLGAMASTRAKVSVIESVFELAPVVGSVTIKSAVGKTPSSALAGTKAVRVVVDPLYPVCKLVVFPEASRVRYTFDENPRPAAVTPAPLVPAGSVLGEIAVSTGFTTIGKLFEAVTCGLVMVSRYF